MNEQQLTDDAAQRRERRTDPRYVDVKAGDVEERRYLISQERPELLDAYQSARLPDHLKVLHINTEGFTATPDVAAEVFAFLESHKAEREKRANDPSAIAGTVVTNPVLMREQTQVELGNVPQAGRGEAVPQARPAVPNVTEKSPEESERPAAETPRPVDVA